MKIDVGDQTIWKSTLELWLFLSIQMKSRSVGRFPQKSTRWCWPWSKMHKIKKTDTILTLKTFEDLNFAFM